MLHHTICDDHFKTSFCCGSVLKELEDRGHFGPRYVT